MKRESSLGKIAEYLQFADFLALLMVAATAFTGLATWRTAGIAHSLLMSSERPYIGVKSVELDTSRAGDPRIEIVYQNFGHIPAENTRVVHRLMIDDKTVAGETKGKNAGILSPEVPHYLVLHIPNGSYTAVAMGRSKLGIEIAANYNRPGGGRLCYLERFAYLADAARFEINGGSTRCEDQDGLSATSTVDRDGD